MIFEGNPKNFNRINKLTKYLGLTDYFNHKINKLYSVNEMNGIMRKAEKNKYFESLVVQYETVNPYNFEPEFHYERRTLELKKVSDIPNITEKNFPFMRILQLNLK